MRLPQIVDDLLKVRKDLLLVQPLLTEVNDLNRVPHRNRRRYKTHLRYTRVSSTHARRASGLLHWHSAAPVTDLVVQHLITAVWQRVGLILVLVVIKVVVICVAGPRQQSSKST